MIKKSKILLLTIICLLFILVFLFFNNRTEIQNNDKINTIDQNISIIIEDYNEDQEIGKDLNNFTPENNNTPESEIILEEQIEEKYYYFGYGSNMDIDLLRRRIGNTKIIPESYGLLKNHKLIFPRGFGSVTPNQDYNVYGCVFLLTEKELKRLDVVEGYREDRDRSFNTYNRDPIEIILPNNQRIIADIYIQVKETEDLPSNNYKQTIIKGANDCNLPREYVDWLEDLETR